MSWMLEMINPDHACIWHHIIRESVDTSEGKTVIQREFSNAEK